jgi:hypothetical protein
MSVRVHEAGDDRTAGRVQNLVGFLEAAVVLVPVANEDDRGAFAAHHRTGEKLDRLL